MLANFVLLLPCTVCFFYAVQLAWRRRENSRSQNILALCMFCTSISFMVLANSMVTEADSVYILLDAVSLLVTPAIFPFMYLYFKSLSSEKPYTWRDFLWFVPAIVLGSSTLVLYFVMGMDNATDYISYRLVYQPVPAEYAAPLYQAHYLVTYQLYNVVLAVQALLISTYSIHGIIRYHSRLEDFYSNLHDKSMDVDNKLLVWFLLSGLFATAFALTGRHFWIQYPNLTLLLFAVWSVVYFGLGYTGSRLKYTVERFALDLEQADAAEAGPDGGRPEAAEAGGALSCGPVNKYAKLTLAFDKLMEEQKLYLKNSLRADEVAHAILSNRIYVAKVIRDKYRCSFSDYINRLRVEYSMQLMRDNPALKQDEIADRSGFLSGSTFNKTFKQVVGIPPGEWCRRELPKG